MWNIKNLLAGIFMVVLIVCGIRGIILHGSGYYYAGIIICAILAVSFFRNCRR